jgi:GMP synthase-like glutamine amidotransferase
MDVWEEERYPWLRAEKRAIGTWVMDLAKPYLGLCLGHQLLAAALGGIVDKAARPEVGVLKVELTQSGRTDPLFEGIAPSFEALQWHGAEVQSPPEGASVLARSPLCAIQAMRVGRHAYGLQYHCELLAETVSDWAAIPTYAAALEASLGAGAMPTLQAAAAERMTAFNRDARRLYRNFMRLARS